MLLLIKTKAKILDQIAGIVQHDGIQYGAGFEIATNSLQCIEEKLKLGAARWDLSSLKDNRV